MAQRPNRAMYAPAHIRRLVASSGGHKKGSKPRTTLTLRTHFCPAQPKWLDNATWQGAVCSGNTTVWKRISCQGGRVTSVDLSSLGASGPLEGLGNLTSLTNLRLDSNQFSGAWDLNRGHLHQDSCCMAP